MEAVRYEATKSKEVVYGTVEAIIPGTVQLLNVYQSDNGKTGLSLP
jgi:hypothetical protein